MIVLDGVSAKAAEFARQSIADSEDTKSAAPFSRSPWKVLEATMEVQVARTEFYDVSECRVDFVKYAKVHRI